MSKIYWSGRELIFEGVEILFGSFRNFAGVKTKYNDAGRRNFNVRIDEDKVEELIQSGLNVKYFKSDLDDEDQDEKPGFVKVNVNYEGRKAPEIFVRYGEKGRFEEWTEREVGDLDTAVFDNVDLILNTYKRDEESPTTLYLNKGYFTLHVDPLAAKYEQAMLNNSDEEELPFS